MLVGGDVIFGPIFEFLLEVDDELLELDHVCALSLKQLVKVNLLVLERWLSGNWWRLNSVAIASRRRWWEDWWWFDVIRRRDLRLGWRRRWLDVIIGAFWWLWWQDRSFHLRW